MIEANTYVVVQKLDGTHKRCSKVVSKNSIVIEKLKFYPDNAVGQSYGLFTVKNGQLIKESCETVLANEDQTSSVSPITLLINSFLTELLQWFE